MKKELLIVVMILLQLPLLFSKELKLEIIDKDLELPLEGVKVVDADNGNSVYTDAEGRALLKVDDERERVIVVISLIGYETVKKSVKQFDRPLQVYMLIEGVLEGEELVIEEEAVGETDEETGVSTVVDKEELKATAMMGPIEDTMAAIKVLPGVAYSGKFNTNLSVRGGDPQGMTTVLDGFVVRNPYHWGGAFSIFNPNFVDSVKFSPGIFSVKHGMATSSLMEVNSVVPDDGFKLNAILSTSTIELFLQTPVGLKDAGLLVGGRLTFYDPIFLLAKPMMEDMGMSFSRTPYIYDAYLKWFWKPHDRVEWYVNSFFGSDGIGMKSLANGVDQTKEIANTSDFRWTNYNTFVASGIKALPHDRLFMHFLAGYEFGYSEADSRTNSKGYREYSTDFVNSFGALLGGAGGYSIDADSAYKQTTIKHSMQTRLDFDVTLHERVMLSAGTGMFLDFTGFDMKGEQWRVGYEGGMPSYKKRVMSSNMADIVILQDFVYLNMLFDIVPERLRIETGVRMDHGILFKADGETVNTYPTASPRFNLSFTPVKDLKYLEYLTISSGVGLFSKTPLEQLMLTDDSPIKDFEVSVPKSLTTVAGIELGFPLGFKFKLEGYYKYIFDRFYINSDKSSATSSSYRNAFKIHTDGIGHAAGFDLSFEKKISRYIDGMLSYSFIYSRLYNPQSAAGEDTTLGGEPTGSWYYPSYHRFHSLNIVLNIKPVNWMTITPKLSFATGVPGADFGEKEMFPATVANEDGSTSVAEMYMRNRSYSDSLRTGFVIPFDLKIAFNFYIPKSKVKVESYIAAEDIFIAVYNLYGPETAGMLTDQFTGEEYPMPKSDINMNFPMVSTGVKFSF